MVDSKGKLNWQVANDDEVNKYMIEKSTNGKDFTAIETIVARRTSAAKAIPQKMQNFLALTTTALKQPTCKT